MKTMMLGKIEGRRRKGQQDEMVEWHHRLNGHEFEQTPGDGEGQGSLACFSLWGHKESETSEQLNNEMNRQGADFPWGLLKEANLILPLEPIPGWTPPQAILSTKRGNSKKFSVMGVSH